MLYCADTQPLNYAEGYNFSQHIDYNFIVQLLVTPVKLFP